MTDIPSKSERRVYLGMPGYGRMTAAAGVGLFRACADMENVRVHYQCGSLLASNFNQLWCGALNRVLCGERVDYFAMLHDDVGPAEYWLDTLIDELEDKQLDVLGVAVPIKDTRGETSLALHNEGDNWTPAGRLTMHDIHQLPETFTSEDIGLPLLLNTGCWVCKFDMKWADKVHFEINDRIVLKQFSDGEWRYQAQTEPEDWFFSRVLHQLDLKIGATRKIAVNHRGEMDFTNERAWGSQTYDSDSLQVSPVPGAFPYEIKGWLHPEEARKLAELAADKRVLEIGSYCGLSTVCMGRTAKHVTSVDYFDGRGTPAPQDTLEEFRSNIRRYGLTDKIEIRYPDETVEANSYDLVFIDGAHDYSSVLSDIRKALSAVTSGGLIAFHDYNHPAHEGLMEAVGELLDEGGELLSITETVAVVRPPARIPLEV